MFYNFHLWALVVYSYGHTSLPILTKEVTYRLSDVYAGCWAIVLGC